MLDYYRILKISPDAPQEKLKAAYIQRLKQFHPDIYKGADATAKTQKINEAYQVLKDPQKRALYDRRRQAAQNSGAGAGAGFGGAGAEGAGESLSEAQILAAVAGGFQSRQRALKKRMEQVIGGLYYDIGRLSKAADGALWARQNLRAAAREDFLRHKQRLLAENAAYYAGFMRPCLSAAALALVAQFRQRQQHFISQTMDSALPEILAAAAGETGQSARRESAAETGGAFAPPAAGGGCAPLWWGFGAGLFFPYFALVFSLLRLMFAAGKNAALKFLIGSLAGYILHFLFYAR